MKYSKAIKREMRGLPPKKARRKLTDEQKTDIKTFFVLAFSVFTFMSACVMYIIM